MGEDSRKKLEYVEGLALRMGARPPAEKAPVIP
jgi:hypothetical protein